MRKALMVAALGVTSALLSSCASTALQPSAPNALREPGSQLANWSTPGGANKSLLYVSDDYIDAVDVLTYPGGKALTALTDLTAHGLCTDTAGNVFVTVENERKGAIFVYAHGGNTVIKKFKLGAAVPQDCAVDPSTGTLAVTLSNDYIDVFRNGRGSPTRYRYASPSHDARLSNCAYDDEGNLFVDLTVPKACHSCVEREIHVGELTQGSSALKKIWSKTLDDAEAGGLQWDGRYLAVGESSYDSAISSTVYRIDEAGHTIGHFALDRSSKVAQFSLVGKTLVGANGGSSSVMLWKYPAGGAPTETLTGFATPYGVTVSLGR